VASRTGAATGAMLDPPFMLLPCGGRFSNKVVQHLLMILRWGAMCFLIDSFSVTGLGREICRAWPQSWEWCLDTYDNRQDAFHLPS
jgi:hypothetical protein